MGWTRDGRESKCEKEQEGKRDEETEKWRERGRKEEETGGREGGKARGGNSHDAVWSLERCERQSQRVH